MFLVIKLFNNQQNEKLTLKRRHHKYLPQKSNSEIEARYAKIFVGNPKMRKKMGKEEHYAIP